MEVPDYYTEINAKGDFTRASGVYRHKDDFLGELTSVQTILSLRTAIKNAGLTIQS